MPTESSFVRRPMLGSALVLALLGACAEETPAPIVPARDGGGERIDAGPVLVRDAGTPDAGSDAATDAGGPSDDPDAGLQPQLDGVLGETEWEAAATAVAATPGFGLFVDDRLTRLVAQRIDRTLYVGIEAELAAEHKIFLLLDTDFGGGDGLVLTGAPLVGGSTPLDRALAAPGWNTPLADLRPDFAWGVSIMPWTRIGADETGGWRDIRTGLFEPIGTASITVCSATACETSIELPEGASTIAVAVRIGDTFGNLSPQTLPLDAAEAPELVTRVLTVP